MTRLFAPPSRFCWLGALALVSFMPLSGCPAETTPIRPGSKGQAQLQLKYDGRDYRFDLGEGELVETEADRSLQILARHAGTLEGALHTQATNETELLVRARFTGSDQQTTGSVSVRAADATGKTTSPLIDDHATIVIDRLAERTRGSFNASGHAKGTDMFSGKAFELTFQIGPQAP